MATTLHSGSSRQEQLEVISPAAVRKKQAKLSQAFDTINKLQFDSIGLVGRNKEAQRLQDHFDQLVEKKRKLILLSGLSGSGKSVLANTLKGPAKRAKGVFVRAKYDAKFRDSQPYSAFGEACNELCREILGRKLKDESVISIFRKELYENIDKSQIQLLESMVPLLSDLAADNSKEKEDEDLGDNGSPVEMAPQRRQRGRRISIFRRQADGGNAQSHHSRSTDLAAVNLGISPKESQAILKLAFQRLIRILASTLKPVIVLLDDLQWVDHSSLELLHAIMEDNDILNLMIIGCYRSDEVDEGHIFAESIEKFKGDMKTSSLVDEISVGNLAKIDVESYIRDLLSASDSTKDVQRLADICHKRTLGNSFFIRIFLTSLHESNLLQFNTNTFQWTWDVAQIQEETATTTDNVIDLLISKMNKISSELKEVLQICSCLGNTFNKSSLLIVMKELQNTSSDQESLDNLLQVAVDEMLFESIDDSTFRFFHDKVQEASALLLSPEEYVELQSRVGTCLYKELNEEDLQNMLFVVVDLLNVGEEETHEKAVLNLEAAKMSFQRSAFASASRYVDCGLAHLKKFDMWKDFFQSTLQLYTLGAEAANALGEREKVRSYIDEVVKQEKATTLDKIRVQKLYFEALPPGERNGVVLEVLTALGFSYPKNKHLQALKAKRTLQVIRKNLPSLEDIERMPFMTDPSGQETLGVLNACMGQFNLTEKESLYILLCCHAYRLTMEEGLTVYAGPLLASFANALMHNMGDWKGATNVAELALKVQSRMDSNYTKASTMNKLNYLVLGFVKPLKGVANSLFEGYKIAIKSGNMSSTSFAACFAMSAELFAGVPLGDVLENFRMYIPQLQYRLALTAKAEAQAVINLIGVESSSNQHVSELKGEMFDVDKVEPSVQFWVTHPYFTGLRKCISCYVCMYYSEYDRGAEIALDDGARSFHEKFASMSMFGMMAFAQGMCLYAMAGSADGTKDRKRFWKAGKKVHKTIKGWVKKGAGNMLHQLMILEAEEAILSGKHNDVIKKAYGNAISTAARGGFIQDAGLANERYASYLMKNKDASSGDSRYYLEEAVKCYSEWGSKKKVAMLKEKLSTADQ